MPWIYAIAGLLVGIAVGMLIARLTTLNIRRRRTCKRTRERKIHLRAAAPRTV